MPTQRHQFILCLSTRVPHFPGVTLPEGTNFEVGVESWGRGDYDTAVKEFRPLADQGNAVAQYNLGLMSYQGQGVPRDDALAHMWVTLAAAQGDQTAFEMRDLLEKSMTPDQLAEAQRLEGSGRRKESNHGVALLAFPILTSFLPVAHDVDCVFPEMKC